MRTKRTKELQNFARELAKQRGHRWTNMREEVYACLLESDLPRTAYQLIAQLSGMQKKDIKPATIYRALEALLELGLAVRIESLTAFRACRHPEHLHQHIFLVCGGCGDTKEIEDAGIGKKLSTDAASHGFRTGRQVLELHGECAKCQV